MFMYFFPWDLQGTRNISPWTFAWWSAYRHFAKNRHCKPIGACTHDQFIMLYSIVHKPILSIFTFFSVIKHSGNKSTQQKTFVFIEYWHGRYVSSQGQVFLILKEIEFLHQKQCWTYYTKRLYIKLYIYLLIIYKFMTQDLIAIA